MPLESGTILSLIVGVAGTVMAMVAPLYYLVLDMRRDDGVANVERESMVEEQQGIREDLDELVGEVREMRTQVESNAQRAERNQKHIHQVLVGEHNSHDRDMGNPHYRAEHCPLDEECPWHDHSGE